MHHLIRRPVYSLETILQAINSFALLSSSSETVRDLHPLLRLLQSLEPQTGLSQSAVLSKISELILQLVDYRSRQLLSSSSSSLSFAESATLSMRRGQAKEAMSLFFQRKDSSDFLRLFYYGKSMIDFLQCCETLSTRHCEGNSRLCVFGESQYYLIASALSSIDLYSSPSRREEGNGSRGLILSRFLEKVLRSREEEERWFGEMVSQFQEIAKKRLSRLSSSEHDLMQWTASFLREKSQQFLLFSSQKRRTREEEEWGLEDLDLLNHHLLQETETEIADFLLSLQQRQISLNEAAGGGGGNLALKASLSSLQYESWLLESVERLLQYSTLVYYLLDYQVSSLSISSWTQLKASSLVQVRGLCLSID